MAQLLLDAPPSMQSQRRKVPSHKPSVLLFKERVVCTQHKGKAECNGDEPAALSHQRALLALRQKVTSRVILFFLFFSSCLVPLIGIQEMHSNLETVT